MFPKASAWLCSAVHLLLLSVAWWQVTFFMIFKSSLTLQEMKSPASQKCISHSSFSTMKLPTEVSREQIPSTDHPTSEPHVIYVTKIQYPPCDHSLQLILPQVPHLLHCPFILTQMSAIIFPISALRIPIKMCILLVLNASQVSSFLTPSLSFYS